MNSSSSSSTVDTGLVATTPVQSTDSTDLVGRVKATIAHLSEKLGALPDENWEPRPAARERIIAERELYRSRCHHLQLLLFHLTSLPPREPLADWLALLQSAIQEFEQELASIEDHKLRPPTSLTDPSEIRRAERRESAVRESLRTLQRGPETFAQGELMPEPLQVWLEAHGVQQTGGCWFASRGGLQRATAKLEQVDRQRDEATKELGHYLSLYTTDLPSSTTEAAAAAASKAASQSNSIA